MRSEGIILNRKCFTYDDDVVKVVHEVDHVDVKVVRLRPESMFKSKRNLRRAKMLLPVRLSLWSTHFRTYICRRYIFVKHAGLLSALVDRNSALPRCRMAIS